MDTLIDDILIPTDNCRKILQAYQHNLLRIASDGSYKDQHGTAAILISADTTEDHTFDQEMLILVSTTGNEENQSAYRS